MNLIRDIQINKIHLGGGLMNKRELNLFGKECKKIMIELQMSQRTLAQKVGTTDKYLDLIFHGERSGTKYIYKIAEVLSLDIEELGKKIA